MKAIRLVLTLFLADVLMLAAIGLAILLLWAAWQFLSGGGTL
jgi:hypothetical protein